MSKLPGVPVFYYHAIGDGPLAVDPGVFQQQMSYLKEAGVKVVPLGTLLEEMRLGGDLANLACVTFDDGFESTYLNAVPVLQALALRATFFVPVGYLGTSLWGVPRTGRWSIERQAGAVEFRMMSWEQLRDLHRSGMEIGSHSLTHANLTDIPERAAQGEIAGSRRVLEDRLGGPVRVFAYPRGRCSVALARAVEAAGYVGACTTERGYATRASDVFLLPRLPGSTRVADLVCDLRGIRADSLRGRMLRARGYLARAFTAAGRAGR